MAYAAPHSLDEAVALLRRNEGARILAGGQVLLVEPGRREVAHALLVDLRKVPGLTGITKVGGGVTIRAMTTLSEIAADATVRASCAVLAEVAETTGDPQLRNRATIGGALCDTDPDNAFPVIAVLLDATIAIVGSKGARTVTADDFLSRKASLSSDDIITALNVPAREAGSGMAYQAHPNPATLTPICAVGVSVVLGSDGTVRSSRVVLVGAERPMRLQAVEARLTKTRGEDALRVAASVVDGLALRTDLFASADYRQHLARVLTGRALKQALERAGG